MNLLFFVLKGIKSSTNPTVYKQMEDAVPQVAQTAIKMSARKADAPEEEEEEEATVPVMQSLDEAAERIANEPPVGEPVLEREGVKSPHKVKVKNKIFPVGLPKDAFLAAYRAKTQATKTETLEIAWAEYSKVSGDVSGIGRGLRGSAVDPARMAAIVAANQERKKKMIPWEKMQEGIARTQQYEAEKQKLREEMEQKERIFRPLVNGLVSIGDVLAQIPGNPVAPLYKKFAPPGSQFSGQGLSRKKK